MLLNVGLDGLPTANKLWAWLCSSHAEADVTPTNVMANLTKVGNAKSNTARTSSSRIIDCGAFDFSDVLTGTAKSVVVSTDDPANAGAKIIAIQDLNAGAAVNLSTGIIVDDLSIQVGYLTSGSVA